jgi:hypothetical protein
MKKTAQTVILRSTIISGLHRNLCGDYIFF